MVVELEKDGAQLFPGSISGESLKSLEEVLSRRPSRAGLRIYDDAKLSEWISDKRPLGQLVRSRLGAKARPVRVILFDKNRGNNWALGWHQDRTIAVRQRCEVEGFRNWTVKAGVTHVEPPFEFLARMITVRIHLDEVAEDNAPLLIAPGSHRLGRLEESEIAPAVAGRNIFACMASRGDVWIYKTAILHASKAARQPASRRVLQFDFSADDLPGGLEWAGIG